MRLQRNVYRQTADEQYRKMSGNMRNSTGANIDHVEYDTPHALQLEITFRAIPDMSAY